MKVGPPKGFTVIEMLVVLILVGLLTTLLMQGFSYVLGLRIRFLDQLDRQRVGALQMHWFRQVCMTLSPDQPDGEWVFSGEDRLLRGLTLSPLQGGYGAPSPVTLKIENREGQLILQYTSGKGEPLEIGRWQSHEGGFHYLDDEGDWHRQWPPSLETRESPHQLPRGILLAVEDVRGPKVWCVSLSGQRDPPPSIDDMIKKME